jgi:hypothetical protein
MYPFVRIILIVSMQWIPARFDYNRDVSGDTIGATQFGYTRL